MPDSKYQAEADEEEFEKIAGTGTVENEIDLSEELLQRILMFLNPKKLKR